MYATHIFSLLVFEKDNKISVTNDVTGLLCRQFLFAMNSLLLSNLKY